MLFKKTSKQRKIVPGGLEAGMCVLVGTTTTLENWVCG